MSSFMKDVVSEVLQRNRIAAPAGGLAAAAACTADSKGSCPHTCSYPGSCPKPDLPLKRTNYQKEQAARRLAVLSGPAAISGKPPAGQAIAAHRPEAHAVGAAAQQTAPPDANTVRRREFAEACLSPLLLRTLAPLEQQAGRTREKASAPQLPQEPQSPLEPSRLPATGELDVWLFPRIRDDLRPLLGSPARHFTAAGVISAASCHPGQLFAAEELLTGEPGLEPDIRWSADGGGFELKLFSKDHELAAAKLKELTARIQDGAGAAVRVWISLQPGPLLRRYFGGGQQEAIAVVLASSRWNSIGIAEQWLQRHPSSGLQLRTERGYCILSGNAGQISAAAAGLTGLAVPGRSS